MTTNPQSASRALRSQTSSRDERLYVTRIRAMGKSRVLW